ncbi:MAG: diguanylate cyclase [bacterium]|nr:diguanylate cyclase [bacterium]
MKGFKSAMKRKIFIILILTLTGFSVFIVYIILSNLTTVLQDSISARAIRSREGLSYLIAQEKARLLTTLTDYAYWTDMGEMGVKKQDKKWLKENLDPWIRRTFGYELIILLKSNGEIISKGVSPDVPVRELISTDGKTKDGFYLSGDRLILYSSSGIFDNSGETFYNAYLILGKVIDEKLLASWKNIIQADILLSIPNKVYTTNPNIKETKVGSEGYKYHSGYIVTKIPVTERNQESANFYVYRYDGALNNIYKAFLITTFLSIFLALLVAIILARFFIIKIFAPLDSLKKCLEDFKEGLYKTDINIKGNDEIASLAKSFEEMASKIMERESALEVAKLQAQELSYKDDLTNIPNRRYMEEYVAKLINLGKEFSIIFLDLDGFKRVNDVLGHQRGDELLHNIAKWFKRHLREEDMVVTRYGGDEFCLILVGTDKERADKVIQRLHQNFHDEDFFEEEIPISFSYGIATYPSDGNNIYELLNLADRKMYEMKSGKKKSLD